MSQLLLQKKLHPLVLKLFSELKLHDADDKAVTKILESIIDSNVELKRQGSEKLRPLIQEILNSHLFNKSKKSSNSIPKRSASSDSNTLLNYVNSAERLQSVDFLVPTNNNGENTESGTAPPLAVSYFNRSI